MEQIRQGNGTQRTITAEAPTTRTDGTPLDPGDISHYLWTLTLQGGQPGAPIATDLVNGVFTDDFDIDSAAVGIYELSYQTVDSDGRESVPSNTLSIEVLAPLANPNPPVIG